MDDSSKHHLPSHPASDGPGNTDESLGRDKIPDTVSDQVDLVSSQENFTYSILHSEHIQSPGSIEPSQSPDLRTSHSSDGDFIPDEVDEQDYESDCEDPLAFLKWLTSQPKCSYCYTPEGSPDVLKKCTRCWTALYCSCQCQSDHWPEHRLLCKAHS